MNSSSWLGGSPAEHPLAVAIDTTNSFFGLAYKIGRGPGRPVLA